MKKIKGGVTAAKGFEAASAAAGIKYQGRTDMALVYSQKPCEAAGTFTTNVVKAAPVKWDKKVVESNAKPQVIVINSGIANACTGDAGMECCKEVAKEVTKVLETETESVLIGSTGVIGMQLPVEKMKDGVHLLAKEKAEGLEMGNLAAKAIMTTDTKEKEAAVTIELDGTTVTIGGMAKGSGMIHPNMCTMLAFITTDAVISKEALQAALSSDVEETYNMISVDGDTSTNDTVLLLANQIAGNKKIAGDGEGATALLEVTVQGAETKQQAKTLAKSVICSNLTKTAIAGHDANWGRILCAMGYAGVEFEPEKTDLFIQSSAGELKLVENGMALDYSEEKATEILSQTEVCVVADIKAGTEKATAWGCDLTHGYIDINADYRS